MITANGCHRDPVAGNAPETIFSLLALCLFSDFRKQTFWLDTTCAVCFDTLPRQWTPRHASNGVRDDCPNDDDDGGDGDKDDNGR